MGRQRSLTSRHFHSLSHRPLVSTMIPEFQRLPTVPLAAIMSLMNHPLVRRQMPPARERFDERATEAFVASKEQLWSEFGYGPWAFLVDGAFAGWGGLQPENGEPDLALVLHPNSSASASSAGRSMRHDTKPCGPWRRIQSREPLRRFFFPGWCASWTQSPGSSIRERSSLSRAMIFPGCCRASRMAAT